MRIAIPVWGDRVSTVFDTADELCIMENKAGAPTVQTRTPISGASIMAKTALLKTSDVQVLICGALPRPVEYMIESAGIRVIPFIRGTVDEVFNAFINNELDNHVFVMPGCRRRRRRGGRGFCIGGPSARKEGGSVKNENSHTGKRTGPVKPV